MNELTAWILFASLMAIIFAVKVWLDKKYDEAIERQNKEMENNRVEHKKPFVDFNKV